MHFFLIFLASHRPPTPPPFPQLRFSPWPRSSWPRRPTAPPPWAGPPASCRGDGGWTSCPPRWSHACRSSFQEALQKEGEERFEKKKIIMFMMCRLTGLKHSEKVILDVGDPRFPAPLRKNKQSVTIRTSNGIKEGKRPTPRFRTAHFIWSVPGVKKQNSVSGSEVQWKWSKYFFCVWKQLAGLSGRFKTFRERASDLWPLWVRGKDFPSEGTRLEAIFFFLLKCTAPQSLDCQWMKG